MLLTVSAKKLPPVTRLQAKTTARMRADVRPKILGMYNLHDKLLVLNASHVSHTFDPKRQMRRLTTLKQEE